MYRKICEISYLNAVSLDAFPFDDEVDIVRNIGSDDVGDYDLLVLPVSKREELIGGRKKITKRGRGRPRKTDAVHRSGSQESKSAPPLLKPLNLGVSTSRSPRETKNRLKPQNVTLEATKDAPNISETPQSCSPNEGSDFIQGRLRNRDKVKVQSYFAPYKKSSCREARRKAVEAVNAGMSVKKAAELYNLPLLVVRSAIYRLRYREKVRARADDVGSHQDDKCSNVHFSDLESVNATENPSMESFGDSKTLIDDMGRLSLRRFRGSYNYVGPQKLTPPEPGDRSDMKTDEAEYLGRIRKNAKIIKDDHANRWDDGALIETEYTHGSTPRLYKQYSPEWLRMALEDMKAGRMSCNDAASHYKIPYGTLYKHRMRGCQEPGPSASYTKSIHLEQASVSQPLNQTSDIIYSGLGKAGAGQSVRTSVKCGQGHSPKIWAESSHDDDLGRRRNCSDIEADGANDSGYKRNGNNDLGHIRFSSISTAKNDDCDLGDQDKISNTYNLRRLKDRKKIKLNTDDDVIRWKDGGLIEPRSKGYYVRPRVKKLYSPERVRMALEDVKAGRLSFKDAANHYSIPYDMLLYKRKLSGCHKSGPSTTSCGPISLEQSSNSQPETITNCGLVETGTVEAGNPPVKRGRGRPPKIRAGIMGIFKRGQGRRLKIKNTDGTPSPEKRPRANPCRPNLDIDLNAQETCQPSLDYDPPKPQLVSSKNPVVLLEMLNQDETLLESPVDLEKRKSNRPSNKSVGSYPSKLRPEDSDCPSKMLESRQRQNLTNNSFSCSSVFGLQTKNSDYLVELPPLESRPLDRLGTVQGLSNHSQSLHNTASSGCEGSNLRGPTQEIPIQDHKLNTPDLPSSLQPEISSRSCQTPGMPIPDVNPPESPDFSQGSATPCQDESRLCPENSILLASGGGRLPNSIQEECSDSSPSQSGTFRTSQPEDSKLLCCSPRMPILDGAPESTGALVMSQNHQNRSLPNMTESFAVTPASQLGNVTTESISGMPILEGPPGFSDSLEGQENLSHNLSLPTTVDSFPTPPVLQPVSPIQPGFIGSNTPKTP